MIIAATNLRRALILLSFFCWAAVPVCAADTYYWVFYNDLQLTSGEFPRDRDSGLQATMLARMIEPRVVLDGPGEAVDGGQSLLIRAPQGADVTGRLYVPNKNYSGLVELTFKIPAAKGDGRFKADFLLGRQEHYEHLLAWRIAGTPCFRHEAIESQRELRQTVPDPQLLPPISAGDVTLLETIAPVPSGRAQAERVILTEFTQPTAPKEESVEIASLKGIEIPKIDWARAIKGAKPKLDPLAQSIPADQYALFFPTIEELRRIADDWQQFDAQILPALAVTKGESRILHRYEQQLGLSLANLERLREGAVSRVAITGADIDLATGADIAVLFESTAPQQLRDQLNTSIGAIAGATLEAKAVSGIIDGVAYSGFRTPERTMSVFLAHWGQVVVVTNSLGQLARLTQVRQGKLASIASLPEYRFFRNRYPMGDSTESALLILSEAMIRRVGSAAWRIASSRRTRDEAVIAEIQTANADVLVRQNVKPSRLQSKLAAIDLGELQLTDSGVVSSVRGTLGFQTPIIDLLLPTNVSKQEAEAYTQWRDAVQQVSHWNIGPAALRITSREEKLGVDLSISPIVPPKEDEALLRALMNANLKPDDLDPHDSLLHVALAFNRDTLGALRAAELIRQHVPVAGDPLSWLGSSIAVYADDDAIWDELLRVDGLPQLEPLLQRVVTRLPIAVQLGVADPIKLKAALATLRAFIDRSAPDLAVWEVQHYRDQDYFRVRLTETAAKKLKLGDLKTAAIYYLVAEKYILVTVSESLMHRALDRQSDRSTSQHAGKPLPEFGRPWIGSTFCLQLNQQGFKMLLERFKVSDKLFFNLRSNSWSNLPILNEWKRRFPDRDPIEVQAQILQTPLPSATGESYVWSERWHTMESTLYGNPAAPKTPTVMALDWCSDINLGLSLDESSPRIRLECSRGPRKPIRPMPEP